MLTDVLFKDRVNDLTFIVAEKLVKFHEQQSSINENIPLRFHIYSGRTYEKLFDNKLLYRENRIAVPTPEFFVLYNGVNPFPEKKTYRLSDAFASPPENGLSLELVVTAYNINKGYNEAIVGKDEYLHGYVTFCAMVRENEQRGASREKAVKTAIEECIRLGILAEYLQSNASEVINMIFQEWNWDDAKTVWDEESEIRGESRERVKWQSIVADKDAALADKDAALADKDAALADKDAALADKDAALADKDAALADKDAELADKDAALVDKDTVIAALRAQLDRLASESQAGLLQQAV